ncbi:MAG: DegV family protein [Clostridiales bacterium]|jgi:DegV family protein with EDD domain|nr:DegV family protein [Clostridiales bacterium]
MNPIKLIVDSTCAMPETLIEKYGIAVLPLQIIIGGKSYRDGVDITIDRLYEEMRDGVVPKTSQINLADTEELFRSVCESGGDLIYFSFSSGMSGTYNAAQMVAKELSAKFPERKLTVIDSQGGGAASGLIALQAARKIALGERYENVVSLIEEMISQMQHMFTVDTLSWLVKGGRLNRLKGRIGDLLQIKPIFNIVDKNMNLMKLVRGKKAVLRSMIQTFAEKVKDFPAQLVAIQHADDLETAKQFEQMVHEAEPKAKTLILPLGGVMASHIGIGGVGLFFFKKPIPGYDLPNETDIYRLNF